MKAWVHKVVLEEEEGLLKKNNTKTSAAEEAAAAAKSAAAAASDVARTSQEMLMSKTEGGFVMDSCQFVLDYYHFHVSYSTVFSCS